MTVFETVNESAKIKNEAYTLMNSAEFNSLSSDEQDLIMFALAIYMDSYGYWDEFYDDWDEVIEGRVIPGERDLIKTASQNGRIRSDVWGALSGAIGGLLGGGPFGFAGRIPVGAALGSLGHAIGI